MRGSITMACLFGILALDPALATGLRVEEPAGIPSNVVFDAVVLAQMSEAALSNSVDSVELEVAQAEQIVPAVDRLLPQSEEQRIFRRANGSKYIEIASGLNFQDEAGAWKSSRVAPKTTPSGSVTFDELPVQHTFAPWCGQRVVVESSRRGSPVARSALGGLSYYDLSSGKSALIAWVTNSPVQAYDGGVFYERAFLGVDADILYKVHPWGLEQDVVIFGGLPDPKAFGMDPAQTKLCALTELVDFDLSQAGIDRAGDVEPAEPAVASLEVSARQGSDWKRLYNWQPGYAYPEEGTLMVGAGDAGDQAHPVAMRLFSAMGRVFLSEEVPVSHVAKSMPGLLAAKVQDGVVRVESIQEQQPLALPPVRSNEKLVADQSSAIGPQAYIRRTPRYVLDYINYYGTNTTGITFASGQTYYISAPLIVSGGKLIIQPNAVVKLGTGAYVKMQGSASLDCRSHAISPAYFTSAYDTNVGEVVLSGASPSSNRYAKGLSLTTESNQLSGLIFRYADTAIEIAAAGNHKLRDVQMRSSLHAGIISGAATAELQNILVYDGADGLHLSCQKAILENCTFQKLTNWAVYGITSLTNLTVRNSLFYEVFRSYSSNSAMQATFLGNAAYNVTTGWMGSSVVTLASNTFTVGSYGSNYLVVGSAAINAGTTNADLLGLYHYTTATNGMKETNSLVDIGFHYGTTADQDNDGMPDYLEDQSGDGLYASNSTDISNWSTNDSDGDTLLDGAEYFTHGTNPKSTDTDNDGVSDALEIQNGSDPLNAGSTLWSLSGTVGYSGIQTGTLHVLVTSYAPLTNRPAMDYSFDEDRNGYTPDISGSGREGTIYGATWKTNGVKGGCYTFDGNDRITLGGLDAANGSYNLTWTAWMRYTGGGVLGGLLGNTAAGNEGIILMKGGEYLRADITPQSRSATRIAETGGLVTQGIWQLVSGTYDGTQVRLYLNGDLVATSAVYSVEPIHSNSLNATIGDVTDGRGWYFYGDLDEVRIYKSTFTTNEMKSLFFEIGGSVIRRTWSTNILASSSEFIVPNLPSGSNYWITAWRDANGNGRIDHWEAQGRYSGFVGNLSGNSNNLAITMTDPDLDGDGAGDGVEMVAGTDLRSTNSIPVTASGQVIYSGGQTGPIYITARPYETITDTPLLRYGFNTSNSTIVLDESGNGITGFISNAKWTSGGIRSGAYRFDGNANINLGDLSAVEGRTGLTFGAWVNQAYGSSLRGIMGKMESGGESFLLVSTPSSGSLNAQVEPQSRTQVRDAAVNGVATGMVWQYVACTYDGQQTRLYLDGQLIATSPVYAVEGIMSNNTVAALGDVAVGRGWYLNGRLDDVHIYGRCFNTNEMYNLAASIRPENIIRVITNAQPGAFVFTNLPNARKYWFEAYRDSNCNGQRDGAEAWVVWSNNPAFVQNSVTNINLALVEADSDQDGIPDWWEIKYGLNSDSLLASNLVAWWRFEEAAGSVASNSVSTNHVGTMVNMSVTNRVSGRLGSALWFNGTNNYVTVSNSLSTAITNYITVDAWVWMDPLDEVSSFRAILGEVYGYNSVDFEVYIDGASPVLKAGFFDTDWRTLGETAAFPTLMWVRVTASYDGNTMRLYRDGLQRASSVISRSLPDSTQGWRIGHRHDYGGPPDLWHGRIDELRVYSSALSSNAVATMYDALADGDGDGLSNGQEYQMGTNPNVVDTDGDGMPDWWEVATGLNPLSSAGDNGVAGDPDKDQLCNLGEYQQDTDPFDFDTDGDLLADGPEVTRYITSPKNAFSQNAWYPDWVVKLMAYNSSTNADLRRTIEYPNNGCVPIVLWPTAATNRYEFYFTDDGYVWRLAETAFLGSSGTSRWYDCGGPGRPSVPYYRSYYCGRADDPDNDGLGSSYECDFVSDLHGTYSSPDMWDSDGDGISDGNEDFDGDGRSNSEEYNSPANANYNPCIRGSSDPFAVDTDGDGVSDGPLTNGPDMFPLDPAGAFDTDCDGMPDYLNGSFASNSEPPLQADPDDDNDGIADTNEISALAQIVPITIAPFKLVSIHTRPTNVWLSSYSSMVVSGTNLFPGFDWKPEARNMTLVSNYVWELVHTVQQQANAKFKFTADGNWTTNWGDDNQSVTNVPITGQVAEQSSGVNIALGGQLNGTYRFLFNEQTRAYSVEKLTLTNMGPEQFDVSSSGRGLPYASGSDASNGYGNVHGGIFFNHDGTNLYLGLAGVDVGERTVLMVFLDTDGTAGGVTNLAHLSNDPEAFGTANNLSFNAASFTPNVGILVGCKSFWGRNVPWAYVGDNKVGQGVYRLSSTGVYHFAGFSTNGGGLFSQWGDRVAGHSPANAGIEIGLALTQLGLTVGTNFKAAAIFAGGTSGANRHFSQEAYGESVTGWADNAVSLIGAPVYLSSQSASTTGGMASYSSGDVMMQGFYWAVPRPPFSPQTSMTVAATFNGWNQAATLMTLVGDETWDYIVNLSAPTGFAFKFAANGEWQPQWGATNGAAGRSMPISNAVAATSGDTNTDIRVTGSVNGLVRFRVNTKDKRYWVEYVTNGTPIVWLPGYQTNYWHEHLRRMVVTNSLTNFSMVWLPQPVKCNSNPWSSGYDPYDHYDLGATNVATISKNAKFTRFGSDTELIGCSAAMNQTGIVPMVDLVINHMAGGWGGGGRYNYDYYHDTFEKRDTTGNNSSNYFNTAGSFAPFQVDLGYGTDSGDINHRHPYMRQGLKTWGAWLSSKVGYRAYRWDVAYHIDPWFISEFMNYGPMKGKFAVMEGWSLESGFSIKEMETYVALTDQRAAMFDMPLAEKLRLMCNLPASFDMETLNSGSFASIRPEKAVTFVESHDTIRAYGDSDQTKKGIQQYKEIAYAYVLLSEGYPCVFYHDYFEPPYVDINASSSGWQGAPLRDKIDPLIAARKTYAAGTTEYLSTSNRFHLYIARRTGDGQKPGCILVINNHTTSGLTNTVNVAGFYTNGTVLVDALNTNHSITVSGGVANIGASNRAYRVYVKP